MPLLHEEEKKDCASGEKWVVRVLFSHSSSKRTDSDELREGIFMTGIWIVLCFVCFMIGVISGIGLCGLLDLSKDTEDNPDDNDDERGDII